MPLCRVLSPPFILGDMAFSLPRGQSLLLKTIGIVFCAVPSLPAFPDDVEHPPFPKFRMLDVRRIEPFERVVTCQVADE